MQGEEEGLGIGCHRAALANTLQLFSLEGTTLVSSQRCICLFKEYFFSSRPSYDPPGDAVVTKESGALSSLSLQSGGRDKY